MRCSRCALFVWRHECLVIAHESAYRLFVASVSLGRCDRLTKAFDAMGICTYKAIETSLEELLSTLLDTLSIHACEAEEVELEGTPCTS